MGVGVGVGVGGGGRGGVEGLHQGNGEVVCIGREMQEDPASLVKIKEGGENFFISVSKNSKTRPIKEMDYLQNGAQQQHLSHAFCF